MQENNLIVKFLGGANHKVEYNEEYRVLSSSNRNYDGGSNIRQMRELAAGVPTATPTMIDRSIYSRCFSVLVDGVWSLSNGCFNIDVLGSYVFQFNVGTYYGSLINFDSIATYSKSSPIYLRMQTSLSMIPWKVMFVNNVTIDALIGRATGKFQIQTTDFALQLLNVNAEMAWTPHENVSDITAQFVCSISQNTLNERNSAVSFIQSSILWKNHSNHESSFFKFYLMEAPTLVLLNSSLINNLNFTSKLPKYRVGLTTDLTLSYHSPYHWKVSVKGLNIGWVISRQLSKVFTQMELLMQPQINNTAGSFRVTFIDFQYNNYHQFSGNNAITLKKDVNSDQINFLASSNMKVAYLDDFLFWNASSSINSQSNPIRLGAYDRSILFLTTTSFHATYLDENLVSLSVLGSGNCAITNPLTWKFSADQISVNINHKFVALATMGVDMSLTKKGRLNLYVNQTSSYNYDSIYRGHLLSMFPKEEAIFIVSSATWDVSSNSTGYVTLYSKSHNIPYLSLMLSDAIISKRRIWKSENDYELNSTFTYKPLGTRSFSSSIPIEILRRVDTEFDLNGILSTTRIKKFSSAMANSNSNTAITLAQPTYCISMSIGSNGYYYNYYDLNMVTAIKAIKSVLSAYPSVTSNIHWDSIFDEVILGCKYSGHYCYKYVDCLQNCGSYCISNDCFMSLSSDFNFNLPCNTSYLCIQVGKILLESVFDGRFSSAVGQIQNISLSNLPSFKANYVKSGVCTAQGSGNPYPSYYNSYNSYYYSSYSSSLGPTMVDTPRNSFVLSSRGGFHIDSAFEWDTIVDSFTVRNSSNALASTSPYLSTYFAMSGYIATLIGVSPISGTLMQFIRVSSAGSNTQSSSTSTVSNALQQTFQLDNKFTFSLNSLFGDATMTATYSQISQPSNNTEYLKISGGLGYTTPQSYSQTLILRKRFYYNVSVSTNTHGYVERRNFEIHSIPECQISVSLITGRNTTAMDYYNFEQRIPNILASVIQSQGLQISASNIALATVSLAYSSNYPLSVSPINLNFFFVNPNDSIIFTTADYSYINGPTKVISSSNILLYSGPADVICYAYGLALKKSIVGGSFQKTLNMTLGKKNADFIALISPNNVTIKSWHSYYSGFFQTKSPLMLPGNLIPFSSNGAIDILIFSWLNWTLNINSEFLNNKTLNDFSARLLLRGDLDGRATINIKNKYEYHNNLINHSHTLTFDSNSAVTWLFSDYARGYFIADSVGDLKSRFGETNNSNINLWSVHADSSHWTPTSSNLSNYEGTLCGRDYVHNSSCSSLHNYSVNVTIGSNTNIFSTLYSYGNQYCQVVAFVGGCPWQQYEINSLAYDKTIRDAIVAYFSA